MTGYTTRKQRCSRVICQGNQRGHRTPRPRRCLPLDDDIVFDADPSLHIANMKEFSLRLRKHNLKLFPSKATIGGTDADFFGHTLSPADIMPNALFFFFF